MWQQHRAHNWQSEHRDWQQRGGYNGYRIPEDRYRGYFGPDHGFRIYSYPVEMVGGYPRFQYGGFSFSVVDPWPEYWSDNWYENDDVYIDYSGDGYYLYNRRYPRDRIAIKRLRELTVHRAMHRNAIEISPAVISVIARTTAHEAREWPRMKDRRVLVQRKQFILRRYI